MIIIEMDSGSEAFHALNTATTDPGTYKLRIAFDEGQFKIKLNEGVWTPGRDGVTVKANGSTVQVLRDMAFPAVLILPTPEEMASTMTETFSPANVSTAAGYNAAIESLKEYAKVIGLELVGWGAVPNDPPKIRIEIIDDDEMERGVWTCPHCGNVSPELNLIEAGENSLMAQIDDDPDNPEWHASGDLCETTTIGYQCYSCSGWVAPEEEVHW